MGFLSGKENHSFCYKLCDWPGRLGRLGRFGRILDGPPIYWEKTDENRCFGPTAIFFRKKKIFSLKCFSLF